jgi:flagellar hook-length control protein FliK
MHYAGTTLMDVAREKTIKPQLFDLLPQVKPLPENNAGANDFSKWLQSPDPAQTRESASRDMNSRENRESVSRSNEKRTESTANGKSPNQDASAYEEPSSVTPDTKEASAANAEQDATEEVKADEPEKKEEGDETNSANATDATVLLAASAAILSPDGAAKVVMSEATTASETGEVIAAENTAASKAKSEVPSVTAAETTSATLATAAAAEASNQAKIATNQAAEVESVTAEVKATEQAISEEAAPLLTETKKTEKAVASVEKQQAATHPHADASQAKLAVEQTSVVEPVPQETVTAEQTVSTSEVPPPEIGEPAKAEPKSDKPSGASVGESAKHAAAPETPVAVNPVADVATVIDATNKPVEKGTESPVVRDGMNTSAIGDAPRTASSLLKAVVTKTSGPEATTETNIDPARFLQRVARAFQVAHHREGEVRLRLHPPELGAIKVELQVQDGTLTARVQTETSEARTVLLDNLPALRERLAEQGIKIEKFDVDLFDQSGGQPQQSGQQTEEKRERNPYVRTSLRTDSAQRTEASDTPAVPTRGLNSQRINIIV